MGLHLPPVVGLWLTFGFIFFLFRRERREKTSVSGALWIPLIWVLITGSRFVSQWLSLGSAGTGPVDEGSPIDAAVFFSLIVGGLYVLNQRRVSLSEFAKYNRWLIIFLLYCLVAVLWSDFPFVAFKRWIKILGHPIMALLVLTEPDPKEAVRRLLKRSAYVLVPLSICFIKFYPEYGRAFSFWDGEAWNTGVSQNKNGLGCDCMILGLFFFWNTLQAFQIKNRKARRSELLLSVGFLAMVWWLLSQASSATSLTAMLVGWFTIGLVGLGVVNRRFIGTYLVIGILVFAVLDPIFGIYANVIKSLGRNLTLTDRTDLWREVFRLQNNPIFGLGFESFWLGERLQALWKEFPWRPIQAHNGYIETYLNLGIVGVALLVGQIIGTFGKIRLDLLKRFQFAQFRLGFLFAIAVFNYTEAAFVNTSLVWTIFFLIAVDYPRSRRLSQSVGEVLQPRKQPMVSAGA
jgi:exopolysaccharide production protein ExoQ